MLVLTMKFVFNCQNKLDNLGSLKKRLILQRLSEVEGLSFFFKIFLKIP